MCFNIHLIASQHHQYHQWRWLLSSKAFWLFISNTRNLFLKCTKKPQRVLSQVKKLPTETIIIKPYGSFHVRLVHSNAINSRHNINNTHLKSLFNMELDKAEAYTRKPFVWCVSHMEPMPWTQMPVKHDSFCLYFHPQLCTFWELIKTPGPKVQTQSPADTIKKQSRRGNQLAFFNQIQLYLNRKKS